MTMSEYFKINLSAISKSTLPSRTSTKTVIILGIAIGLILVSFQYAKAIPYTSPEDLYKQSDMVFYGQVISKQAGPGPDYDYYQVKVETYFKNPQTSDSITVAGHKPDPKVGYPQFEVGDKAIFYIDKIQGINTISVYSTKAGEGCDLHAFLGPSPIPGEPLIRGVPLPLHVTNVDETKRGSFNVNEGVLVSYGAWNNFPQSRNFTVEITVSNQNDSTISFYKKQTVEAGACDSNTIKWSFVPTKGGNYIVNATENGKFRAGTSFEIVDSNSHPSVNSIVISPLQQLKSGVKKPYIKCNQDFVLVIKKEGHWPACVNPDTVSKLVLRGWTENPLGELLLRYGNQTQANLVFYEIMNEPKVREWSMKGWKYSSYSYASNGETQKFSATIDLYLPPSIGNHLECENGSYALVVMNLRPVEIEHNYTQVGCNIVSFSIASNESGMTGKNLNSSSPLKLSLLIDNQYANPAQPIGVDISLNNTNSNKLTLNSEDNWPRNDLRSGPCSNLPFGIAILKGYYTEQNMTGASSLVIYPNLPCPLPPSIKSYTFDPLSNKATQECDSLFSCPESTNMKIHLKIDGFIDNNGQHRPFNIGKYTIIAGDEWGHVTIQHFTEDYGTPLISSENNCGQFYTAPENQHDLKTVPVLLMNTNSTGCARLSFTIGYSYNGTVWPRMASFAPILFIGNVHYSTNGNSFSMTLGKDYTNSFKITVMPETIDLADYPVGSKFSVTYIIRSLPNATGFYDQSIPKLVCERYPLAVGFTSDQVNASDFNYIYPLEPPCASGPYELTGVEISGMNYKWVTLP